MPGDGNRATVLVLALLAGAALAGAARGQCQPPFQQEFVPADGHLGQAFGVALALEGARLLVGAEGDGEAAPVAGAGYVFEFDGSEWIESAKLIAPDALPGDNLGITGALSGDWALLGQPTYVGHSGAVRVFKRSAGEWSFVQTIVNPAGEFGSFFGVALAASGDRLIVGAPYSDLVAPDVGVAYVFRRVGDLWTLEKRLQPPLGPQGGYPDGFGWSVGIWGTRAAVAAPYADSPLVDDGRAWVYEWTGSDWTASAQLMSSDAQAGGAFGRSLALWQDKLVVGAPYESAFSSGAAYVFELAGTAWAQTARLEPPAIVSQLQFGETVALHGNHALVCALNDSTAGTQAGAAWLFVDDGASWTRLAKLVGPDTELGDSFGSKFALGPARLVIGAFNHNEPGFASGAVYAYGYCSWSDIGGSHPGASGPPLLAGSGTLAAGTPNALSLSGGAPSAPGLLFLAAGSAGAASFKGGVLKAVPALLAVPVQTSASGQLLLPFVAPILPAGACLVVQVAVADAGAGAGVALSNALLGTAP